MEQITVRVPASTSNLGPGFDCLGVALRIHNNVTVARGVSRQHLHPRIVSEAADRFFNQARRRAFSFSCSIAEQIPRSRGLGSSATIRLGILLALNRLSGNPLDRLMIFQLCAELEGHPDNAVPASFGGFTVAGSENFQRFDVASQHAHAHRVERRNPGLGEAAAADQVAREERPKAEDVEKFTYAPSEVDAVYPGDYTGLPAGDD